MSAADLGGVDSREVHGQQAVRQLVAFGYVVTGPERGCVFFFEQGGAGILCIKPSYDEPL